MYTCMCVSIAQFGSNVLTSTCIHIFKHPKKHACSRNQCTYIHTYQLCRSARMFSRQHVYMNVLTSTHIHECSHVNTCTHMQSTKKRRVYICKDQFTHAYFHRAGRARIFLLQHVYTYSNNKQSMHVVKINVHMYVHIKCAGRARIFSRQATCRISASGSLLLWCLPSRAFRRVTSWFRPFVHRQMGAVFSLPSPGTHTIHRNRHSQKSLM